MSAVFIFTDINKPQVDTWIKLKIPEKGIVGYSPNGLINEIPLPEINHIEGQAKFVNREKNYFLGYKVVIDIDNLDTSKVPKQYLQDKEVEINNKKVTALGLDQVIYGITLKFTLLDKDNFEITELASKTLIVTSGKRNELQGLIENLIPIKTIEMTRNIRLYVSVDKCLSCTDTNNSVP
jgi:hypothetical protein